MTDPGSTDPLAATRRKAWVGDAVLELYVRQWVLRRHGRVDADLKRRFTCNEFLNCHGNPTQVEAQIGEVFEDQGLDAAFRWIETRLEPLFVKQEARRRRLDRR